MAKMHYNLADGSGVTLQGASMAHLEGLRDRDPARAKSKGVQVPLRNVVDDDGGEGHLEIPVMNFSEDEESDAAVHNDNSEEAIFRRTARLG